VNGRDRQGLTVAVLTHLSDQYGDVSGHWYLEAKFGLLEGLDHPTCRSGRSPREYQAAPGQRALGGFAFHKRFSGILGAGMSHIGTPET
jgi:hypothetical protein